MNQFSSFFQSGGILDVVSVNTETEILLARGAFAGTAHVTRFDLARSEEPATGGTFAYGGTHRFDLFGSVGSFSVGGGIHVVVIHTLFTKEFAKALRACVTGLLSVTL